MQQQAVEQLVVLVSASEAADDVRRDLSRRGVALASATASLARLRRSLVSGSQPAPIVFCITLDEPTLRRHGRKVARLLDDRDSFASPVRAIGLRVGGSAPAGWASLGCDACAADADDFERLLRRFATSEVRAQIVGREPAMPLALQLRREVVGSKVDVLSRRMIRRNARTRAKWT